MEQISDDQVKKFIQLACDEAVIAVTSNEGGPFGAIVVKNGEIISRGHNRVIETNDPTAHAEVIAIRLATAKLGTFKLNGCVLYSSCEPCPMCLAACLWARLDKVYYACTQKDAAEIGFDDGVFYSVLADENKRNQFAVVANLENAKRPMELWKQKEDKVRY